MELVKIVVFVPLAYADIVREAIGKAGAEENGILNIAGCLLSEQEEDNFASL